MSERDDDRLGTTDHRGRYDDELVAVVLDALHEADGVALPYETEAEVTRPHGDPSAGYVRLTVFVDEFLERRPDPDRDTDDEKPGDE